MNSDNTPGIDALAQAIADAENWIKAKDEWLANARLIAAAPDMLAVLKETVALYGREGGPWNVPGDPGGWLARARAIIARAEACE